MGCLSPRQVHAEAERYEAERVANDSRDRSFDVLWQAHRYDPDAEYVRTWCPELAEIPGAQAHEPWTLTADEESEYGVELGDDYPEPMVDPGIYEGPDD